MTNPVKINFTTKQLTSGNVQVKFYVLDSRKSIYGYLLVDSGLSEQQIREEIEMRLKSQTRMDLLRFTFKNQWKDDHQFFLYSA
ncbi:hypothetical protein SAMN04488057_10777 [Cyclobacterium lianum]|uniref:Uncharacterized protein n=1 Tax=Cyclobacterium lianum TaxID=388280 RepID=A0A1M7P833_9BACT|nr:hypothetical protein [Cyclobacterium lianum]SHN12357.1 hypothetical protein SAMN04488057_10777 [Cyclobacterium lianum]